MASDPNLKVRVKLNARCLVDRVKREKDEIVEVPEAIADSFGVRVDASGQPLKSLKPAEKQLEA